MILVDTAVWIDHLHSSEPALVTSLEQAEVLQHPMVVGELALGDLRNRAAILGFLANLPSTTIAGHDDVMRLVEARNLYGQGLSLVDAHILASVILMPGTRLWTRDKRLRVAAENLGVLHRRRSDDA